MSVPFLTIACPYCGERYDTAVDADPSDVQRYVEDCAVCCRPIVFVVAPGGDGEPAVRTLREDESA